jgi:dipeptidyl aminopeptidase/acylaminoacyl peptidase
MTIPRIYGVLPSPNKSFFAFGANRIQENYDIFLGEMSGYSEIIPLTRTPEVTLITDWSPDSQSIIVGEDKARNERVTLYRVFIDSPFEMHPLTPVEPDHYMRGGYFSPNGEFIAYAVNYDYDLKKETETFRVVVQDLETGSRTVIARPDKPAYIELSVDPRGTHILYSRSDEDPSGIQWWIASPDGNVDREVLNFGPKAKVEAAWTHDGRIAFSTDTIEGNRHDSVGIGLYSIGTGKIEWLAVPEVGEPFDRVSVPKYSQHVMMIQEREGRNKCFLYDLTHEKLTNTTPLRGNIFPVSSLSPTEWIGIYYSSTNPFNIIKFNPFNPDPSSFVYLTDMLKGSGISKDELTPATDYRWISVDNTMIHGWLYTPKHSNGKTILHIHGGPTAHSSDALNVAIQYFCSLGFNVLDPNYRGSTGYGVNFRELMKKDGWGGNDKEDLRTGIQSLIENGIANPGQVGIFGTSYGGYMSWNAIAHFPMETIAAAAPICGMTDLMVDYETTRPDLRPLSEEMLGGSPKDVPEIYRERSPINFVQNIKGNLLIIQGLRDPNVTKANVAEVEKQLVKHGIKYEKLVFDDEGHGIIREENQKVLFKRLADFFEQSLIG